MDLDKLLKISQKPKLFERSDSLLWDDPHISKQMLKAHLNPDWDAASRKFSTMDASVKWLEEEIFWGKDLKILDLGCGPGLYASRLAERGYSVTGIDFSQRSINYALKKADENNLDLQYIYRDYLRMDYQEEFDVIMMIYCDLGALTNEERNTILEKIYRALKPKGTFIFDVFTDKNRGESESATSWEVAKNGFWKDKPYLALTETFRYPEDDVLLDQTIVMTEEGEVNQFRIFEHFYRKATITQVLEQFGFTDHSYYSDVTGRKYSEESKTIAITTKKQI